MTEHLTSTELQAYAERTLSARDLLRLDRHLAQCSVCTAELARAASLSAATRIVRRVDRAGPHLAYEQLEALVDRRAVADEPALRRHLSDCPVCTRELAEMQGYAAKLSAPLARREPKPSLSARLGSWFGGRAAFGAATAALAVAVAVTAVWQSGMFTPAGDTVHSAVVGAPPSDRMRDSYDRSAFDDLASLSAPAQAAFLKQDYAALASLLKPLAVAGDVRAQAALGLLYAEGRGVVANLAEAERLFALGAERNASARHNLSVLRARKTSAPK